MINFVNIEEARLYGKELLKKYDYVYNFKFRFGFVYLIVTEKGCKVGITSDLFQGLKTIKNSLINTNIECVIVSPLCENRRDIEKGFTKHFQQYNINNKWFDYNKTSSYVDFLECQNYILPKIDEKEESELSIEAKDTVKQMYKYFRG